MTKTTFETFKETREQLQAAQENLKELRGRIFTGDSKELTHLALQIEQIEALKRQYIKDYEALRTTLPHGAELSPGQFQSLGRFASNNGLGIDQVLSRIHVKDGFVVECHCSNMNLTTLSGLKGLVRLSKLSINDNPELTSLQGIPTQMICVIDARYCGLTGDLSALSGANKLWKLYLHGNKGLTSLRGLPTQNIWGIYAESCGLTGDLSELSGADKLEDINVWFNKGIASLVGIPTERIRRIMAVGCGLTGDHTFLSEAVNLEALDLRGNSNMTLDKTKFNHVRLAL
jgi:hypothetical protein